MKLLARIKEWRARQVPAGDPAMSGPMFVSRTTSGVRVNSNTVLTLSAVWNAVGLISDTVAGFPWHVMRRKPDGTKEHNIGGPVDRLLHTRPNPEMTPYTFRQTLTSHRLLWGNGYAEIERNNAGAPIALWPLPPDRVDVVRDARGLAYQVRTDAGEVFQLPAENVLHIRGLGFDGIVGYSVIAFARESFGLGLATEQVGAAVFGNGLRPGGQLELDGRLTPEARKQLRKEVEGRHRGPQNAGSVMILEKGTKFTPSMIPPDDAQWIEARKFQVTEVARWFHVPPHKIGDLEKATFSNIAEQNIDFVQSAIMPIVLGWEQEANWKLLALDALFTKMNMRSLLRGNPTQQSEFYRTMINAGVFSVNEVRELEDMNPIGSEGDKHFIQMNMTTLDKIGEDRKPEPAPNVLPEPDTEGEPAEDADTNVKRAMRAVFHDAADRVIRKDAKAIRSQLKRFKETGQLATWLGVYFAENKVHIANQISPPIRALAESVGCSSQSVWVDAVIDQLTCQHIARSVAELVTAFDDGNIDATLDDWQITRVAGFAEQLTESAMVAAMLERNDGKQTNDGDRRRIPGG